MDYTSQLPTDRGFKAQRFDDLPNHYTNDGVEVRGYLLDNRGVKTENDEHVDDIDTSLALPEGAVIYLVNPVRQFTEFTNKTEQLHADGGLYLSETYLHESDLNEGDTVRVATSLGELTVTVISDNKIDGAIACLPTFDSKINSEALFSGYRFTSASIKKV
ncbi:MAG: ferredoxin [Sulfurimonas sp.]|nr:MAG: ferredoxin [Sulfurimonas sp.]